jgi:hypothetical protein
MATAGSLNHRRATARIDSAAPDPAQSGGPPDRGFTGTWCEVVGWEPGGPDAGVAERFFQDWRETDEDNRCMTNADVNVAGLGVYERGNRWWATLEMAQDTTPPAATKPKATPDAAERLVPHVTAAPTNLAESRTSATASSGFGPKEIAVAVLGFSIVPILHFVRVRRRKAARV